MRKTLIAYCVLAVAFVVSAHADVAYPAGADDTTQVVEQFPGIPPNADILKYRHRRAFWPPYRWRQGQRVIKIRYRPYPGVYPYRPRFYPPKPPYRVLP